MELLSTERIVLEVTETSEFVSYKGGCGLSLTSVEDESYFFHSYRDAQMAEQALINQGVLGPHAQGALDSLDASYRVDDITGCFSTGGGTGDFFVVEVPETGDYVGQKGGGWFIASSINEAYIHKTADDAKAAAKAVLFQGLVGAFVPGGPTSAVPTLVDLAACFGGGGS